MIIIPKLLVIIGPTSSGKTDLALLFAKRFDGEIIACDSRQVYKNLDIGTGKFPSKQVKVKKNKGYWIVNDVKIWLYDVLDYRRQYTVYDYVKDATRVVEEVLKKGKLPIIVGGTGLYLKALFEGLPNLSVPPDLKLRKKLQKLSLAELQKKLMNSFPKRWENMNYSDRQNPRRLIRALELKNLKKFTDSNSLKKKFNVLKIGLSVPRDILYQRIDERVIKRINQGMIKEAKKLHSKDLSFKRMKQLGLEYGVLADYLQGNISSKENLIKILQGKIHGYAKRQMTWFKKEKNILWFNITEKNFLNKVESKVNSWYYSLDAEKN